MARFLVIAFGAAVGLCGFSFLIINMQKQKTWKQINKGNEFRPASLNEKLAIAVLVGATAWITIERIAWYLTGQLKLWF